MHIYQNGERCPCCGEVLRDKTAEWLELFSYTCELLGLRPIEEGGPTPLEEWEEENADD